MFLSNAFVILIAVITVGESNLQECKPLIQCPALLSMIQTKPNHKSTIRSLRSRHCGFDGRMPKVWCDNSKFMNFTCKTPNLVEGTCTPIKDCKYMIGLLKGFDLNNTNTKAFIRGHKCNTVENDNISVCCPKKDMEIRELLPNSEQCGISKPFPLCCKNCHCMINAMQTTIGQYPWMAMLYFRTEDDKVYPGCGGSLISKKFVLTAAHCLDKDIWSTLNVKKLEHVVLGEFDTKTDPDCFDGACADPVKNLIAESIYIHHQWNRHTIQNDIALIKLKETVAYTDFIGPICLPNPKSNAELDENVIVAGWGKTESGHSSSSLLHASLPIVHHNKCSFARKEISSKQLCIGVTYGSDSCRGDSGGPVMDRNNHLIGIVSYGSRNCGIRPGVYTYVTPYLDWIHEIIEQDIILNGP